MSICAPVSAQLAEVPGTDAQDGLQETRMARIITDQSVPEDCLASVAINKIDGEHQLVSARGFLIEPGMHRLNGLATLDLTHCSISAGDQPMTTTTDFEYNFEAGITYYIAYSHKSHIAEERGLVVWRLERSFPLQPVIQ